MAHTGGTLIVEPATSVGDPTTKPYRPYGALLQVFRSRARELVVEGAADTGKSRACLEWLYLVATKYPGMRGAIVRKTRRSLTATAMETFQRQVCPDGAARLWHDEMFRFANGSVVFLFGLDDAERLKSTELDACYVQEVSECTQDDWEVLLTRVTGRGAVMPYTRLLADLNPMHPGWWLYTREAEGKVEFIHTRHEDNPSITPERLAALDSLTGWRYQRLRLGQRVSAEGMYFTEWDPRLHVCEAFDPPADWTRWISVDYGFAHPFVALWFARERPGGRVYVYREVSAAGLRDEQQAQLIVERSAGEQISLITLDPSMFNMRSEQQRPSIAQVYANAGVHRLAAGGIVPGMNSRKQGWAIVRRALAHGLDVAQQRGVDVENLPRLQIMDSRAPHLIKNLPAMVMDPLDPEDLADKIGHVRTPDDEVDALRYGLCAEAQPSEDRQIRSLTFG
jgi:phage terminase large subunit